MRKIFGVFLMSLPIVLLFVYVSINDGITFAIKVIGGSLLIMAIIIACFYFGFKLIFND